MHLKIEQALAQGMKMESKRIYKRLPCKQCPTLVMCRARNPIQCKLLYNYIFDEHLTPADSTFYRRMNKIRSIFNERYREYNWYVNSKHEVGFHWRRKKKRRR